MTVNMSGEIERLIERSGYSGSRSMADWRLAVASSGTPHSVSHRQSDRDTDGQTDGRTDGHTTETERDTQRERERMRET